MGVLELNSVEGSVARPVNHQALVGHAVGEEEVVASSMVVTLVGQDALGIPVVGVGRVAALDLEGATWKGAERQSIITTTGHTGMKKKREADLEHSHSRAPAGAGAAFCSKPIHCMPEPTP